VSLPIACIEIPTATLAALEGMNANTLIFTWGNPSRGDDALGTLFGERIAEIAAAHPEWGEVECLTDFQLQIEHALDLHERGRVLFVDASLDAAPPYAVSSIAPQRDASFTSHAMTPQAVLQVYVDLEDEPPPPAWLLAIRGEAFELGAPIAPGAQNNLEAALVWAASWLAEPAPS
jgi:hydrogenase maturation protease